MTKYKLTTASGKVFYIQEMTKGPLEAVADKWIGESMHYGETSSKVIGVEEAEDGRWPFKPHEVYEAKVISFNVVFFDGDKHLSMALLAKSVDAAKKLLEDFFGGYLPAYDLFLHGKCVHQYNGQKK
jgi:hypothetical protein